MPTRNSTGQPDQIMTSYVVGQARKQAKSTDTVTVGRDAWATGNPAARLGDVPEAEACRYRLKTSIRA